ncbi:MAG: TIGR01777 family oxidoreductase [Chitinophagales bacterium]|nr:TIGR01777 family oxidoreductase [Bacteroidota bacterium]
MQNTQINTILITGGSGLVGTLLSEMLLQKGYTVRHLSRTPKANSQIEQFAWDIDKQYIDAAAFENVDALVHLAGANIGEKMWTASRKKEIISSRVDSLVLIQKYLAQQKLQLKSFVSTSATGIYGSRGDVLLTENSSIGSGFLTEVCQKWENAAQELGNSFCDRYCILRLGVVLAAKGGALERLDQSIRLAGLSVLPGGGKQFLPWIHLQDVCNIFLQAVENEDFTDSINAVAPNVVRLETLMETAAHQLNKKYIPVKVPAWVLKMAMGDMATLALDSANVSSEKLQALGYKFSYATLPAALADIYQKS